MAFCGAAVVLRPTTRRRPARREAGSALSATWRGWSGSETAAARFRRSKQVEHPGDSGDHRLLVPGGNARFIDGQQHRAVPFGGGGGLS